MRRTVQRIYLFAKGRCYVFHFTAVMEDNVLIATDVGHALSAEEILKLHESGTPAPPNLSVVGSDNFTGKSGTAKWTPQQLCAVIALAFGAGEEKWLGYDVDALYATAEPLFKDWPAECRPIP